MTENGLMVEPLRTNYVVHALDMTAGTTPTAPWAFTGATATTTTGGFIDGVSNWTVLTSTAASNELHQTTTTASSTTFIASAWAKAGSGTTDATVTVQCPTAATTTACTCLTSDGTACNAVKDYYVVGDCNARVTNAITTAPVRVSAMATCAAAGTSVIVRLNPTNQSNAARTTYFNGAQVEIGTYPTSLIPTTTATVPRNADVISVQNPLVLGDRRWCLSGSYTPVEHRPWGLLSIGGANALWELGLNGGTNTGRLLEASSGYAQFNVYDALGAVRTGFSIRSLTLGARRIVTCVHDVVPTITLDGTPQAAWTGGGSGVWLAMPNPLYLGTAADGTLSFGGYIQNIKVCRTSSAGTCR